jgi:hypothetical protein
MTDDRVPLAELMAKSEDSKSSEHRGRERAACRYGAEFDDLSVI